MKLARGTKVLVTGADGFIGSHLVERLVRDGCSVRAFVFYNSFGSWGWLDHIPTEIREQIEISAGDVRDYDSVRAAVAGCSVVFHLAALISIPYSYRAPRSYVETNVGGTLNVLQAATAENTSRVIQTSTSEVYGTAQFVPISELHPLSAQSPYAASKIAADQLAFSFWRSYGTPVSIVRPFNTFGPRQSVRAIIPTIISQIAAGERRIKVGATHTTRDFTYVDDTVEAFVKLAEVDDAVGSVTNVGCNFEVSVGDLLAKIAHVMHADVEIEQEMARVRPAASEVERLWCDNSRIRALTGWTPRFSGEHGFTEGLTRTAAWFAESSNATQRPTVYGI